MDPNLVGTWQNQSDDKEYMTIRADGKLRWFYRGVPMIGIRDSIVEYTYQVNLTKSPAHFDLIHRGAMGTSYFIYQVTDDQLRLGVGDGKSAGENRVETFGPTDRYYKRVSDEPGK